MKNLIYFPRGLQVDTGWGNKVTRPEGSVTSLNEIQGSEPTGGYYKETGDVLESFRYVC